MADPMRYAEVVSGEVVHVCEVYRADDQKPPSLATISRQAPSGVSLRAVPDGLDVSPGWWIDAGQFVEPTPGVPAPPAES